MTYFSQENGQLHFAMKNGCHKFGPIYDYYFRDVKDEVQNFLEIGIGFGGSLKMWRKYFPNATVWGIDIKPYFKQDIGNNRIKIIIGDQTDISLLDSIDCIFDFIVDDGSHMGHDQLVSFTHLFPKLKSGGIYFVEDTFFPYRTSNGDFSFLNFLKNKIDKFQLYGKTKRMDYYSGSNKFPEFKDDIYAMHIYTGMAALVKA